MSLTDPVADILTRIRNAIKARHQKVDVPPSKLKLEMARILKEEGYISNYKATEEEGHKILRMYLKYRVRQCLHDFRLGARFAARLPGVRAAQRDSPRAGRHGYQYPDHAEGRDDGPPGAQRRSGRRSPVRSLVANRSDQPSAATFADKAAA